MGVGADLYMYNVVVKKFTFAISSPDEFLVTVAMACRSLQQVVNGCDPTSCGR